MRAPEFDEPGAVTDPPAIQSADGMARVGAGLAGMVLLLVGSLFTIGGAFVAAVGVWIAALIARARGNSLTRFPAWLGAFGAVVLYAVLAGALLARSLPEGTIDEIRAAADSASAQQEVPAWIERMAPGTAARTHRQSDMNPYVSGAIAIWGGLVGGAIVLSIFASVGWGAAMLLVLAFTGRWIPAASPTP